MNVKGTMTYLRVLLAHAEIHNVNLYCLTDSTVVHPGNCTRLQGCECPGELIHMVAQGVEHPKLGYSRGVEARGQSGILVPV